MTAKKSDSLVVSSLSTWKWHSRTRHRRETACRRALSGEARHGPGRRAHRLGWPGSSMEEAGHINTGPWPGDPKLQSRGAASGGRRRIRGGSRRALGRAFFSAVETFNASDYQRQRSVDLFDSGGSPNWRNRHIRVTRSSYSLISLSEDTLLAIPRPLRREVLGQPLQDQRCRPWPLPLWNGLGSSSSVATDGGHSRRRRLHFMLRTGELRGPASHPASRPCTGALLPGTLASPRTGLAPAGCPQLVDRLRRVNLLVALAPELLDALHNVPTRRRSSVNDDASSRTMRRRRSPV
jgi:hypothetical protein